MDQRSQLLLLQDLQRKPDLRPPATPDSPQLWKPCWDCRWTSGYKLEMARRTISGESILWTPGATSDFLIWRWMLALSVASLCWEISSSLGWWSSTQHLWGWPQILNPAACTSRMLGLQGCLLCFTWEGVLLILPWSLEWVSCLTASRMLGYSPSLVTLVLFVWVYVRKIFFLLSSFYLVSLIFLFWIFSPPLRQLHVPPCPELSKFALIT